ncbi:hypothetical protein AKJ16_DCAP26664 [Drosera capensis]
MGIAVSFVLSSRATFLRDRWVPRLGFSCIQAISEGRI